MSPMTTLWHSMQDEIRDTLLWRTVTKVSDDTIKLDNGKTLKLVGNEGCGGCQSGWYDLTELSEVPNAITAVEFYDSPGDDYGEGEGVYRIFVYAANEKIKLAEFDGHDGNGYYGTGYWIEVSE